MNSTIFIKKNMAQSQFSPPQDVVSLERNKYDAKYVNRDQARGYNVGTYEYPEGLRVKPDLQHYVAFYINVREKSSEGKRLTNYGDFGEEPRAFRPSEEEAKRVAAQRNTASNLSQNDLQKGADTVLDNLGSLTAAGIVGKSAFDLIRKASSGNLSVADAASATAKAAILAPVLGGAVAAGASIVKSLQIPAFAFGTTARLKDVITLHLEERPVVKYGTNYTEKELGVLTGLVVQGSAKETLSGADYSEGLARLISEVAKLPSLKAGGGTLNDLRELSTRTKTNPFREVMFESVDYRSFNFRYRFFPKSQLETDKIRDIIDLFKRHMHPEITNNKLFYIYPSEFQIAYYYKNDVNKYLHNFATCVLTDMQVEYGGDQFATFENGAPVEIGLSLTFREVEQMTSEGIRANGY